MRTSIFEWFLIIKLIIVTVFTTSIVYAYQCKQPIWTTGKSVNQDEATIAILLNLFVLALYVLFVIIRHRFKQQNKINGN